MTTTTDNARFQMFSDEGNDFLAAGIARLAEKAAAGGLTRRMLSDSLGDLQADACKHGFIECYDTEPEWAIVDEVNALICTPQMWLPVTRDDIPWR